MSKRNAVAFEVPGYDHPDSKKPGAFWFVETKASAKGGIVHACPCGCGAHGALFFRGKGVGQAEWDVAGEWPKVSLTPSIGFYGSADSPKGADGFHWHGFLRNGVFEEC